MGRGDNKKGRAIPPATDKTVPDPTPRPPVPSPEPPALRPRQGISNPRVTTDNPWRDLHPSRIWPD